MEQRIEPISGESSSARLQLADLAAATRAAQQPAAATRPQVTQSAQAAQLEGDTWERGPSEPPPAFPPVIHMRARIAAAMSVESPAQSGLDLLNSAASATQELSQILSQLTSLVGGGGGSAELERMRIQVQQLLNQIRFQQGPSIDGSTLGDALRADLEADGASPSSSATSDAA